jgi:hypothetical protein
MDDTMMQSLEKLFYRKIMLYNDLLHYFKKERESLMNIDLDELWRISKEKEDICSEIKSTRQEILSTITDPKIDKTSFRLRQMLDLIPKENRAKFQELYRTLINLKSEVDVLRKENMAFIDDSLQFLDEMISIITSERESETMYNDKCHLSKSGAPMLLSREA